MSDPILQISGLEVAVDSAAIVRRLVCRLAAVAPATRLKSEVALTPLNESLVLPPVPTRVIVCTPDDTMQHAQEVMRDNKFRHLPVLKAEQLVGVISIGDIVKMRVQEIETDAAAMRDYIQTA